MNLFLIRHGQSTGNVAGRFQGWSNLPLTGEGRRQAERTGAFLAQYAERERLPIAALYSSDLDRAWHTAEAIGRHLGLAPVADADLREMNFGAIEGMTGDEWKTVYPELIPAWARHDNPAFGWPGGETRQAFYDRLTTTFDRLMAAHPPDANLVIVTHGAVIGTYLAHLDTGEPHEWRRFIITNCSISRVEFTPGADHPLGVACILTSNETAHLADDPINEV
jgi:probable phosphoglycerate mutase